MRTENKVNLLSAVEAFLTGVAVAGLLFVYAAPALHAARFPYKIQFFDAGRADSLPLRHDNFAADRTAPRKQEGERCLFDALSETGTHTSSRAESSRNLAASPV